MPLVQKAHGLGSATFAVPTQPTNVVLVAACVDDDVTDIGTVTDNLAPVTSYSLVTSYSQSNFQQAEVYYLRDTARPGGTLTVTVSGGGGVKVWIYELSGAELAMDTGEGNNSHDSGQSATPSSQPNSAIPSFCPNFARTDHGCGFFLLAVCACTAGVVSVGPDWSLDTIQGGDAAAYRFVPDVSTLGTSPVVTFTAGGVTEFALAVGAMNQPSGATTQNIIVRKQTNPLGSPQTFTFRPSWAAPFTLMDGQSMDSGTLAPGTYSVSEDAVPGFTTTTNIDPTNIVLGPGQTITVIFTNSLLAPPCVPLDGSGVMANGTFIPDLALFIGPSTELYKNPIAAAVIKTFETLDEGRNAIVLDFNNSDGLYSRDLGTIFEWPVALHDVLYVWQPSIIPMPETIYGRASDWDDGGYTGDKFIQGITIEADSFGVAKMFQLQSSDDLTVHTLNEVPTTFVKQTLKSFSCNPFISHSVRIVSSDGIKWRVWGSKLVFEPLPSACKQWQTELVSLGMIGWAHAREMNIPHISTADLNLLLTFDTGITMALTIPNSGGKQIKTKVTLVANKFKLVGLRLLSTAPFRLFESDLEMKVKPWGSGESYQVLRPFGGPSSPGATV